MKLKIFDLSKSAVGEKKLPAQFDECIRPDLVRRAVDAIQSHKRQPYGSSPEAGKRASAYVSKRRRDYKTTYGIGQSRTPRKILSRRGSRMNWVGAFAPQTVGGRRAHPPKAGKIWDQKINITDRRHAIRSAISSTIKKELVNERGHIIPDDYPFIIDDKIESIKKSKELVDVLKKLGFEKELERAEDRKTRAGRGKLRGRRYISKKSLLIVVSKKSELSRAAENIPGVEVVEAKNLNAEILAPGALIGRATLWTSSSIEMLEKEKLFL